eukprot:scaffold2927_cov143-Cylindrotheca_fusiformis.AAC.3
MLFGHGWVLVPDHVDRSNPGVAGQSRKKTCTREKSTTMTKIKILEEIRKNRSHCLDLVKKFEQANVNCEDVANAKSQSGWLPLHYVMIFCKGEGILELVQFLVRRHPKCVQAKTDRNELPINLMPPTTNPQPIIDAMQRDQLQARLYLMNKYPEGVTLEDKDGETPIVRAVISRCNIILKAILDKFPHLAKQPNSIGKLPLHYAMETANADAVKLLYSVYPDGIEVKDQAGTTPAQILSKIPDKDKVIAALVDVLCDVFEISCACGGGECTCKFSNQMMPQFLNENNLPMWSLDVVWCLIRNGNDSQNYPPSSPEARLKGNKVERDDKPSIVNVNKDTTPSLRRQPRRKSGELRKPDKQPRKSAELRKSDSYDFQKFTKKGQFQALRQSFENSSAITR